ncbi:sensor histidine kinase [Brumimicrobium mesophilum]|uniref:sensor histidine kinase n=1 Tax=Brumimicrobium mesophilum TaxID=392717 RepID=UPI000D1444C3|nr:HAMP domain-containing sensor histidine kinase [Brumimicrobium mesophilum]
MKLYSNKQKWKIALLFIALALVGASLYASNKIVNEVAKRERERVTQWADAIKKRAELVRLTNNSFEELRKKELSEMQLWIDATKEISRKTSLDSQQSYEFPLKIINRNDDIPVIVLDQENSVSTFINIQLSKEELSTGFPEKSEKEIEKLFTDTLVKLAYSWEKINPSFTIEVYDDLFMTYFYNDSRNILRLEEERDSLFQAFNTELIENAELVPVVLTDSSKQKVIASNLLKDTLNGQELTIRLNELSEENIPIKIRFSENEVSYVFYATSPELVQLQYFPFIQFGIIFLFILIGYIIFSTFRKAEQNKVWAGMAKETAHQLGTPISSLMAWVQLLEGMDNMEDISKEMNKDVERLSQVTDRFSKIGASTQLNDLDIVKTTTHFLDYFRTRFPQKVELTFTSSDDEINIPHNAALFEWVIENISKNAIDAMEGVGKLDISINQINGQILIDISDTGKGMTIAQQRSVFQPGFTTKKRGWGLGLPLAKRIIHEYHKGRLKILNSEVGKGTTFRIILSP